MLNSRRVPTENLETTPETMRADEESELAPQILANEELPIVRSVARLETWGASAIDVNMGCPVKKALSHNYGVALMGDPTYAADVVRIAARATALPVSVKLRAGKQNDLGYLIDFVRGLEDAGAAWITLHPRTAEQKRRGSADWDQIRLVRESVAMPVIGNGDIQTADDALEMLAQTGCDLAMCGRALTARPWLLWQVGERLGWAPPPGREGQRAPQTPEEEGAECGRALLNLVALMRPRFSADLGLRKFRFLVRTASPWLVFGHRLYALCSGAKSYDELEDRIGAFFAVEQAMTGRTELRQ
jgi:tRNA-dihydrouridine synthase